MSRLNLLMSMENFLFACARHAGCGDHIVTLRQEPGLYGITVIHRRVEGDDGEAVRFFAKRDLYPVLPLDDAPDILHADWLSERLIPNHPVTEWLKEVHDYENATNQRGRHRRDDGGADPRADCSGDGEGAPPPPGAG